ncbi:MAG: hypothetical protein EAZ55_03250 [Cytophagales bacterium]|nr:MAG: hypothetical protein EAZ55_03250 [Cytophagales bacterium]
MKRNNFLAYLYTLIGFLFFSTNTIAQKFPDDWQGTWQGEMTIYNTQTTNTVKVPVEFVILPTDTTGRWIWRTIYQPTQLTGGKAVIKDYRLVVINLATQEYAVDEQDSIVLKSFWLNQHLYCSFMVEGALFNVVYQFNNTEKITWEIFYSDNQINNTGGQNNSPTVGVYNIKGLQRTEVTRKR